jgi:hypothetical protein
MSLEIQVSAWSDVTVAYCTGRVERRADLAPVADIIERYAGWCEMLVLDLSPLRIADPSLMFALREAALSAAAKGTQAVVRLNPIRPADTLASMVGNISGSPLLQRL